MMEDEAHVTDEELLLRSVGGDRDAFATIMDRHLAGIHRFLARLLGSGDDADDASQETFMKAWKARARFRPGHAVRTWLFAIARNVAIDHLRKKRARVFSTMDTEYGSFADTLEDQGPLPDEDAILVEDHADLAEALATLSPETRVLFHLRYTEELTFEEIAEVLSESVNTLKSRHRRALIQLKGLLSGQKQGNSDGFAPKQ